MFQGDVKGRHSPAPPPPSASGALFLMGGGKARARSRTFASGASEAKPEQSNEIDIRVRKTGSMFPFILGAIAGVAGTVAVYKFMKEDKEKK